MDVTYKMQTPSGVQYGYFSAEYLGDDRAEVMKLMIEDAKYLTNAMNKTESSAPLEIGETMREHGHTYKAVMNEGTKKLYWMIDKV